MLVKLVGNKKIIKMYLPEEIEGNYWLTDNSKEEEEKLVNIRGFNNRWVIKSSSECRVINEEYVNAREEGYSIISSPQTVIDKVGISEYSKTVVSLKNRDEVFALYFFPYYEQNARTYRITLEELTLGSGSDCDIIFNDKLVKNKQARLYKKNGEWYIENYDSYFGTFINNKYIDVESDETKINNGDIISIGGVKLFLIKDSINLMGNLKSITINKNSIVETELKHFDTKDIKPDDNENDDISLYDENDYFYAAPRKAEKIVDKTISIDKPPEAKHSDKMTQSMTMLSSIGITISTIIGVIMATMTMQTNSLQFTTKIVTAGAMLGVSILMPLLRILLRRKKEARDERTRQSRYRKYINEKIIKINQIVEEEGKILRDRSIMPEQCERVILEKSPELWERKIDDSDFLKVNLGNGTTSMDMGIEKIDKPFSVKDDDLTDIYYSVVNSSRTINDVPISVSLAEKQIVSIINNNYNELMEYMKNIILQIVALQSYRTLKLVFFVKDINEWDYVKFLPHIWDDSNQIRFLASERNDINEISQYLEEQLNNRKEENANFFNVKTGYKQLDTYYLIVTDNYKDLHDIKIIDEIIENEDNIGFSLLCASRDISQLPNRCKTFVEIHNDEAIIYEDSKEGANRQDFVIDKFEKCDYSKVTKVMANIPIKYSSSKALALPKHYNFLEMFNVGNIEQLNIWDRWNSNDVTASLKTRIGVDSAGDLIYLDAHEKYHGPHGLIAGTTGSGKSEFIITYILSLAVNYHPDDVTFILIDYKGGGLAGAFKKTNIKLPHLVGTITNIDKVGLQRSLESIQSELNRRQRKFNEAKEITNESTIDIYKYQKYYHNKVLKDPISHLFIICDEFAELKQQQPDFMQELMSVSRIGRSLGVHLILATQKPAGIVNDQIRSNSKFGICLKVQDKSDSKDIIKRTDAATLKNAGQFYINVGNDEYFALGQSGYTGVPYVPTATVKKEQNNAVEFISNTGSVIEKVETEKKQQMSEEDKKRGDQLTNIVKYLDKLAEKKNIYEENLWLDAIPAEIYVNKLRKKYNVVTEKNIINPIIGEYDDPSNQYQNILTLNLSKYGNTVIYGSSDSGKEQVLVSAIYDSICTHTTDEVQFYLIDYGAETLRMFKGAPHVGDIILSDDIEKTERLFKMLKNIIKERKDTLVKYNGSYELYLAREKKPMPMIVVAINEYANFIQTFEKKEDDLIRIFKDCSNYGVNFIITATNNSDVRMRVRQNFRNKLVLQMIGDEYSLIFSKVRKKRPSTIYGRGLCSDDDENVYEFQTALIAKTDNLDEKLKVLYEKLKTRNKTIVPVIPVLPKVVENKMVEGALKGLNAVPIGIATKNIEPYAFDFKKNVLSLITASDIEKTFEFLKCFTEEIKKINKIDVVLFDEEELIIKHLDGFVDRFNRMTERLNQNYENREDKNIVYIIIGLDKFIGSLGSSKELFLSNLNGARLAGNCNFIVVDSYSKILSHQADNWYRRYFNGKDGIFIGTEFERQNMFKTITDRRSISQITGDCYGYAIEDKKITSIKVLGIKEEEDDE